MAQGWIHECEVASYFTRPSDGILLPLAQKVAEGSVFHLNKHYSVMLHITHPVRHALKYFLSWPQVSAEAGHFVLRLWTTGELFGGEKMPWTESRIQPPPCLWSGDFFFGFSHGAPPVVSLLRCWLSAFLFIVSADSEAPASFVEELGLGAASCRVHGPANQEGRRSDTWKS